MPVKILYYKFIIMGNSAQGQADLKLKILTGQTQSLQLFDFHSPQKEQYTADLKFPSIIGYSNGEIVYQAGQNINSQVQPLYRIQRNNFRDIIVRQLFQRPEQQPQSYIWKVLCEGQMMQLQQGDSIKIGKTKVTFKQIINNKSSNQTGRNPNLAFNDREQTQRLDISNTVEMTAVKTGQGQCRLCFEGLQTISNPLVSLCKCSGTLKYIHYQCLRDWITNNIKKDKSANCLTYSYFQPNSCQICKQPIQNQFMHEGQKYSLFEFQKIDSTYAVFQNRSFDEQANKMRVSVYNILIPENSQISIGRNHHSQVIFRDISVSRNHCYLIYRHGSLYIQDKKSKFGTLVCPKKGFQFNSYKGLQLQFQSKIIQIIQDKPFNSCCCNQNNSYYVQINKGINDHTF